MEPSGKIAKLVYTRANQINPNSPSSSFKGLSPWLQDNSKGVHTKYASSLLHTTIFHARPMRCQPGPGTVCPTPADFLLERIGKAHPQETTDIAASIAFALGLCAFNMILYLLPMPRCVRRKFRD